MSKPADAIRYPVTLIPDIEAGVFVVTFEDIPEAITQGDSVAHALEMAAEALECAMDFYLEDRRPVPGPSPLKPGQNFVEFPASVVARAGLASLRRRRDAARK
jgi:antitoxin HicB